MVRAEAALERRKRGGKNADFTIQMQKMRKAFRRVGEIAHGYGGVPRLRRRNAARLFGRNVFRYGKTDKKMHGALRHVRGMSLNSVRTGYRRVEHVFRRFFWRREIEERALFNRDIPRRRWCRFAATFIWRREIAERALFNRDIPRCR